LRHFRRWLGFSPRHQSSSAGVISHCPEDWLRTEGSWSGAKIINTCHPLPTPKKPRRHTVDGTTSTRLRTHVSGETASECVASASVTAKRDRFAEAGPRVQAIRASRCLWVLTSDCAPRDDLGRRHLKAERSLHQEPHGAGRRGLRPLGHPRLHLARTSGRDLPGAELGRCNGHLDQDLTRFVVIERCRRGRRPNPWRTRQP
jgi:hypothetical protein